MKFATLVLPVVTLALSGCMQEKSVPADAAALGVSFTDASWTGGKLPSGQQCRKDGGSGNTPALSVSGVPDDAAEIVIAYNDESYAPLSYDGGHGTLAYKATPGTTEIPSLPGESTDLPDGARVVKGNRATGSFAAPGYLPPCSGGRGNLYSAQITAVDGSGKVVGASKIVLGRY